MQTFKQNPTIDVTMPMQPVEVHPVGEEEVLINWQDGHRSLYLYRFLRLNCPCAGCRDEWSGKRLIALDKIPADIKSLEMAPVGRYAIRFRWSDRHETGIYSYDFLRGLCPCEACQNEKGKDS